MSLLSIFLSLMAFVGGRAFCHNFEPLKEEVKSSCYTVGNNLCLISTQIYFFFRCFLGRDDLKRNESQGGGENSLTREVLPNA